MFDSNDIFKKIDEQEESKNFASNFASNKPSDEQWIQDSLSKLLDEENEIDRNSQGFSDRESSHQSLSDQFNRLDSQHSALDQVFAKVEQKQASAKKGLVFPDDEDSQDSVKRKGKCQSNPVNNFNEFQSQNHEYYQNYSNFKSYDVDYNAHQNYGYEHQMNKPLGFETFGQMDYHNTPYSQQIQNEGLHFPDVEPAQCFNSNAGIFSQFDDQDQYGPYSSHNSGGQGCLQFPSGSNMISTNHTSNFMAQFQAYHQDSYGHNSRVSCPVALKHPSNGGLEYAKPQSDAKYKSGEIVKSAFVKQFEARLDNQNDEVLLSDIFGHIFEVSQDQKGSRFIQEVYSMSTDRDKDIIFNEIKAKSKDLMVDKFANYVIQKIFEHGSEAQKEYLAMQIKGSMMSMSMDNHSCRVIQKMLEHFKHPNRLELVNELKDNVEKLIYNKNGNHVVQKIIEYIPEKHLGFVIEEISENVYAFCKHKYGCRVIDRLIEFCKSEEVDQIVEEILPYISELTFDASGNYVAQAIVMHGKISYKKRVISIYKKDLLKFSTQKYASNVMECCFKYCSNAQRKELVKELQKPNKSGPSNLEKMLKDKFGNYVIQKMLEKLDKSDKESTIAKILDICKREKKLNNSANHVLKIIKDRYI